MVEKIPKMEFVQYAIKDYKTTYRLVTYVTYLYTSFLYTNGRWMVGWTQAKHGWWLMVDWFIGLLG